MSTTTNRPDPLVYLDKIQKLYPFGVSTAAIVSPQAAAIEERAVVCLFLVVSKGSEKIPEAHQTLLDAISTKGLRLTVHECLVDSHDSDGFSDQVLIDRVHAQQPVVAIVFGGPVQPGTATTLGSTKVLYARPLETIASDQGFKKEFWKHLQESILPIVTQR